jgi:DNA-binding transcriptional LysR family regulator
MNGPYRWSTVELRMLVAAATVARTGSFAAAGRELGYTQSAVSQQIAALERIVEGRLFVRPGGRRPVVPTELGGVVLRHAERVASTLRALDADLAALADGTAGVVRVGTFPSAGATILPGIVRRYLASHPGIRIQLEEMGYEHELLALLDTGAADLTFVQLPVGGDVAWIELLRDRYALLVPVGSELAVRPVAPTLAEIAAMPLIAYHRTYGAEALLLARGLTPNVVFRTDERQTLQSLVGAGLGVALVPTIGSGPNPATVLVDLGDALPPRIIGLAWSRQRELSPAARAFIALVESLAPIRPPSPEESELIGRKPAVGPTADQRPSGSAGASGSGSEGCGVAAGGT